MKTAIIVGSKGQDGTLLSEFLLNRGYRVVGVSQSELQWIGDFSESDRISDPVNIHQYEQVSNLVRTVCPNEIYFLAAFHHSSEDKPIDRFALIEKSYQVNVYALLCFLESLRNYCQNGRLFYAASSHIFGNPIETPQSEATPFMPLSDYGITKASGTFYCQYYRKCFGIFASVGILYNHESALRKDTFITKKIIKAAINIYQGGKEKLVLGNINSEVDWGYAPDFVEAMYEVLQLEQGDDFVIATGRLSKVKDFVEIAFGKLGLNWINHVVENPNIITRQASRIESKLLLPKVGNASKIKSLTGWKPKTTFEEMVKLLLQAEMRKQKIYFKW